MGLSAYAGPAVAQIVANVGAVTDYVFRGVSQTNEGGGVQGGIDMAFGKAYFGLWLSTVDFNNGTDAEMDMYVGYKPTWMGLSLDIGLVNYGYMGGGGGGDPTFYEVKLTATKPVGAATIGAGIYYTTDYAGTGPHDAYYYEINAAMPVYRDIALSGAIGKQEIQGGVGAYGTWNAGVVWTPTPWMTVDLRYHDTDEHTLGATYEARYVAGVKFTHNF